MSLLFSVWRLVPAFLCSFVLLNAVLIDVVDCQNSISVSSPVTMTSTALGIAALNGKVYATGGTTSGGVIYSVDLTGGKVTPIAGGVSTVYADGVGTAAGLASPSALVGDPHSGHLFFADVLPSTGATIRKLDVATNNVTTVVGNGASCTVAVLVTPVNGPGLQSPACFVTHLAVGPGGNVYYIDFKILRVFNVDSGLVTTLAGSYYGPGVTVPTTYIDSAVGANAYMVSPTFVGLTTDNAGISAWILDGNAIHHVNLSNPNSPVFTPTPSISSGVTALSLWGPMCSSTVTASTLFVVTGCASSTSGGELVSLSTAAAPTNSVSAASLVGGSCAMFKQAAACVAVSTGAGTEAVLVADDDAQSHGVIRQISMNTGGGGHGSSGASSNLASPHGALLAIAVALLFVGVSMA